MEFPVVKNAILEISDGIEDCAGKDLLRLHLYKKWLFIKRYKVLLLREIDFSHLEFIEVNTWRVHTYNLSGKNLISKKIVITFLLL